MTDARPQNEPVLKAEPADYLAKARGVKLGRKPQLTEHRKRQAIRRRDGDGEPVREIARSYNVSHSTISRLT